MITKGLDIAAKGMLSLIDVQDLTANNLANVNTTGFKKSNLTFKNVYDAALYEKTGADSFKYTEQKRVGEIAMGPQSQRLMLDFSQGTLERTNKPFDLGIEGDGFFKLQNSDGGISYTRNGSFVLNNKKQLVSKDGDLVLDVLDRPIVLDVKKMGIENINDLIVAENGQIQTNTADAQKLYQQIKICDFRDRENMVTIGSAKFVPTDKTQNPEIKAEKFSVQQGALEASNSNTVNEMINIINTTRNYETLSKFVKNDSTMLSRAINLGRIASV